MRHAAGELRGSPRAAVRRIKVLAVVAHRLAQDLLLRGRRALGAGVEELLNLPGDVVGRLGYAVGLRVVDLPEFLENREKTGPDAAVSIAGREVGAAEERLAVRREPHVHRPSAAAV